MKRNACGPRASGSLKGKCTLGHLGIDEAVFLSPSMLGSL
jgi:hypothetical protein